MQTLVSERVAHKFTNCFASASHSEITWSLYLCCIVSNTRQCLGILLKPFLDRVPQYAVWHEFGRQGCYRRKNTCKFDFPRPESNGRCPGPGLGLKSRNKKFKLDFAYPSNPGYLCCIVCSTWLTISFVCCYGRETVPKRKYMISHGVHICFLRL